MSEDTEIDPKAKSVVQEIEDIVNVERLWGFVAWDEDTANQVARKIQAYAQERVEAERVRHDNLMGLVNKAMGYAHMVEHPDRHTYGYWIADCDFEPLEAMWKEWVERGTK